MKCKIDLICNIQLDDLIAEISKLTNKSEKEVFDELDNEYLIPEETLYIIYQSGSVDENEPSWIYEIIDSILFKINDFDEVRIWR